MPASVRRRPIGPPSLSRAHRMHSLRRPSHRARRYGLPRRHRAVRAGPPQPTGRDRLGRRLQPRRALPCKRQRQHCSRLGDDDRGRSRAHGARQRSPGRRLQPRRALRRQRKLGRHHSRPGNDDRAGWTTGRSVSTRSTRSPAETRAWAPASLRPQSSFLIGAAGPPRRDVRFERRTVNGDGPIRSIVRRRPGRTAPRTARCRKLRPRGRGSSPVRSGAPAADRRS
jgi:hypothetical protein